MPRSGGSGGGFVDLLLRFRATHGNLLAILRHASGAESSVLEALVQERTKPILRAVVALLEAQQRRGSVRDDLAADALIAATLGMVAYSFVRAWLEQRQLCETEEIPS